MKGSSLMGTPTLLTRAEAAELAGVKVETWSGYVARGQAPKPTDRIYGKPLWDRRVVEDWKQNRPGQGSKLTERAKERALARGLTRDEAAKLAGVSTATWSACVAQGSAPQPIGRRGRVQVWGAGAVSKWAEARE